MLKNSRYVLFAVGLILLAGCEWESSGDDDSWSDNGYSWVNFSGVYRMVDDSSSTSTTGQPRDETMPETGDNSRLSFDGTLSNLPIVAGSVVVSSGAQSYQDSAGDGNLVSSSWDGGGTVNYATGAIEITFQTPPASGESVNVSYRSVALGSSPGINSLTLSQTGNRLSGTDSEGVTYSGDISQLSQSGGDTTGRTSGNVVANFTLTSSNGDQIVGSLTAYYSAPEGGESSSDTVAGSTGMMTSRRIEGTYIGADGATGDVLGVADDAAAGTINSDTTTADDADTTT